MTARRPYANRGFARRKSLGEGASGGRSILGLLALIGLLVMIGGGVALARERLFPSPTAASPGGVGAPGQLVLPTPAPGIPDANGPAAAGAGAPASAPNAGAAAGAAPVVVANGQPTAPPPLPSPTAIQTLRQWDASPDGIQVDPVLVGQLDQALVGIEGTVSVAVKDLASGRGAVLNGSREMEAASLFKLEVLYAVFDAGLPMTEQLPVTGEARAYDAGTMELAADNGEYLSVAEALERMVTLSDNTSAIMLAGRIGSARITRGLGNLGMDTTHYSLERMTTSALDMLDWLDATAKGRAISPAASAEMVHLLLRQKVNDRLPRLLPAEARVAHKTGNLPGVVNDVGILYGPNSTVAVAALVSDTSNEAAATAAIARVGMVAYSYFDDQPLDPDRPTIPQQPARAIPPTWREPKPTPLPTLVPTPVPEPEPTETPVPTRVPATSQPASAPTAAATTRPAAPTPAPQTAPTTRPGPPTPAPTPRPAAPTQAPTVAPGAPGATPTPTRR